MKEYFCGIVEKDNELLLIQRGNRLGYGKWAFPGGKAKENESSKEAVAREVIEETGLSVAVGDKVYEFYHSPEERVQWFVCKYLGGELQPTSDTLDGRWIEKDGVFDLDLREGHNEAVKVYLELKESSDGAKS